MAITLDVEPRLHIPAAAIKQVTERFNALRNAHTERFNPALGASHAELLGAQAKLLREVSTTLMFLLDEMARSVTES